MGITTIVFIVVLLAASGFVAWVGDVVGRVMGKKRIAMFGLRPRKTSVLIAVITGMLITGFTILTLALTSQSVRDMLVHMDEIRAQRDSLIAEKNNAMMAMDVMRKDIETGDQTIEAQKGQIGDLTGNLSTAEDDLCRIQAEKTQLGDEISKYELEVNDLKGQATKLNGELAQLGKDKDALAKEKEARIAELNTQISDRETRIASLNKQIDSRNVEIQQWSEGHVKVREGQQLAGFSIDTGLDDAQLKKELGTKLAAIRDNFRDPVTGENVLTNNEMEIPGEAFAQAIKSIRAVPANRALVLAYASANVLEDEPVSLKIEVIGDSKVFAKGSVIFTETYAKAGKATDPYRAAMASYLEKAKTYLVNEKDIVPTGSGDVIQLTIDDLVALSNKLKSVGFPAEIKMTALADIYRADFLVYGSMFDITISHGGGPEPE
jgi:predicted  nucleic acid-binding Zn-ribbon protein